MPSMFIDVFDKVSTFVASSDINGLFLQRIDDYDISIGTSVFRGSTVLADTVRPATFLWAGTCGKRSCLAVGKLVDMQMSGECKIILGPKDMSPNAATVLLEHDYCPQGSMNTFDGRVYRSHFYNDGSTHSDVLVSVNGTLLRTETSEHEASVPKIIALINGMALGSSKGMYFTLLLGWIWGIRGSFLWSLVVTPSLCMISNLRTSS